MSLGAQLRYSLASGLRALAAEGVRHAQAELARHDVVNRGRYFGSRLALLAVLVVLALLGYGLIIAFLVALIARTLGFEWAFLLTGAVHLGGATWAIAVVRRQLLGVESISSGTATRSGISTAGSQGSGAMDLNLADEVRKKLEDALKSRGVVNIVIAGRTGVGKSTLLNAVFQGDLATTGQGRPVTTCATEYTKAELPVAILDTRGLEMDQFAETAKLLESAVRDRATDTDAKRHLHAAWVCFSEDSRRIETGESAVV